MAHRSYSSRKHHTLRYVQDLFERCCTRVNGVVVVHVAAWQRVAFEMNMEKRLIKKVYEHDLLYKIDHVHYRDKQMRAAAWKDISEDLGIPADQCKEKWRKLRNCYLNAINRRQNKNSNIPKWKFETEMSFLKPFIDIRASQMNMDQMSESPNPSNLSSGYNENMNDEMCSNNDHMSSYHCASPEMILPETSGMMMPFKRRYSEEDEDVSRDMPSSSRKRMGHHRFDETEMFFLSMSEAVKRLRPVDQARVKKELCNLVYEAEIRLLEEAEGMIGHS